MPHKISFLKTKVAGFSLLEMLVASTISSIIFGSALTVVSQLYASQTRVEYAQNFYAEVRLLQERLSHTIRNSTIDYDRYWEDNYDLNSPFYRANPHLTSHDFLIGNETGCNIGPTITGNINFDNNNYIEYEDAFYVNNNGGADGVLDTKIGNTNPDYSIGCSIAVPLKSESKGAGEHLFLISGDRTYRTRISLYKCTTSLTESIPGNSEPYCYWGDTGHVILLERELGIDDDSDGIVDPGTWSSYAEVNPGTGKCEIDGKEVFGDANDEDFCDLAHTAKVISPKLVAINDATFTVTPRGDPYLNYKDKTHGFSGGITTFQIHPLVLWSMDLSIRSPKTYGYSDSSAPNISFQTAVSSRVYGDSRPKRSNHIFRHCKALGNTPTDTGELDAFCEEIE